jgi:hypothetical protein
MAGRRSRPPASAAEAALRHPQLLCFAPRTLRAKFAALQADSGLPPAAVVAVLREQPQLLAAAAAPAEAPREGWSSGGSFS